MDSTEVGRVYGLDVQVVGGSQFEEVIILDGILKHGGQSQDGVVIRQLRAVGDGRRGRRGIVTFKATLCCGCG